MIYIYIYISLSFSISLIILPLTCTHDSHSSPSKSRFVVGRGIDGIDCSIDSSGRAGAPKANVSRCSVDFSGIQKGWFSNKNGGFSMGIYTRLMWIWPDGIYIYIIWNIMWNIGIYHPLNGDFWWVHNEPCDAQWYEHIIVTEKYWVPDATHFVMSLRSITPRK